MAFGPALPVSVTFVPPFGDTLISTAAFAPAEASMEASDVIAVAR